MILGVVVLVIAGVGFIALRAQADEYPPETLLVILQDCTQAVVAGQPFNHPDVIPAAGSDPIVRSETQILSLMGRADAVGGDHRLSIGLEEALESGATLNCSFRYNAFEGSSEADIERIAATQPLIDSWMAQLRTDNGQAGAEPDAVVLCDADRATRVAIRGRYETALAVSIEPADDSTLCTDS